MRQTWKNRTLKDDSVPRKEALPLEQAYWTDGNSSAITDDYSVQNEVTVLMVLTASHFFDGCLLEHLLSLMVLFVWNWSPMFFQRLFLHTKSITVFYLWCTLGCHHFESNKIVVKVIKFDLI